VVIIVSASSKWLDGFRKWYYNAAGFNKLGEYPFCGPPSLVLPEFSTFKEFL
jgi:hypothetical protein